MISKKIILTSSILTLTLLSASIFFANNTTAPVLSKEEESQQVSLSFVSVGAEVERANIFGCGDSLVSLKKDLPKSEDQLNVALTELLNSPDMITNDQGQELYNALSQSNLSLDKVESDGSTTKVYLKGQLTLPGSCDNIRVGEQLTETVENNTTASTVEIFINDVLLEDVLSIKENAQAFPVYEGL